MNSSDFLNYDFLDNAAQKAVRDKHAAQSVADMRFFLNLHTSNGDTSSQFLHDMYHDMCERLVQDNMLDDFFNQIVENDDHKLLNFIVVQSQHSGACNRVAMHPWTTPINLSLGYHILLEGYRNNAFPLFLKHNFFANAAFATQVKNIPLFAKEALTNERSIECFGILYASGLVGSCNLHATIAHMLNTCHGNIQRNDLLKQVRASVPDLYPKDTLKLLRSVKKDESIDSIFYICGLAENDTWDALDCVAQIPHWTYAQCAKDLVARMNWDADTVHQVVSSCMFHDDNVRNFFELFAAHCQPQFQGLLAPYLLDNGAPVHQKLQNFAQKILLEREVNSHSIVGTKRKM